MKKITLLVFAVFVSFFSSHGQVTSYVVAPPNDGGTSVNRAPNGTNAHTYMRACALVLQSELTSITPNTSITSFGFTLATGANGNAAAGSFSLYLENTSDITYNKGTTFATAISSMNQVYGSALTIPISAGTTSVTINLSSAFTYTGGGIYVAYDWYCAGPYSLVSANYHCNYLGLVSGIVTGNSTSSAPTTLASSNFRPCFLFGIANTYTNDINILGIETPGRSATILNSPPLVKAVVKNGSNITKTNININLSATGVNPYTGSQTIPSLAAGAFTTVTFTPYTPTISGLSNMTVSVASDENNVNNSATYAQLITCNEWGQNIPTGTYTTGVGFGTGSGILANLYLNPTASTLTALRGALSDNIPSVGNQAWGVLMDAAANIIATTATLTITSAMLSTFQELSFSSPQSLNANTSYYIGFAQAPNTITGYYPFGSQVFPYVPPTAYISTALTGGAMTPVQQGLGYFTIEAILAHTANISLSSPTAICNGTCATITASGTTNYTWSNSSTSTSVTVCPSVTTTYSVIGTNTAGCKSTALVTLTVNPIPNVNATSNQTAICLGGTVSLSSSGASTYSWDTGPTTQTIVETPSITTTYTVTGTSLAGCSLSKTVEVIVNSFTPSINGPTATCLGDGVSLAASGGNNNSYNWGGFPFATFATTPQVTTTYSVQATGANGCKGTNSITVVVNANPTLTLSAQRKTMCRGEVNTLTVTGASTYSWSVNNFTNSVITVTPNSPVSYSYIATGIESTTGCRDTGMVVIKVNQCTGLNELYTDIHYDVYPNPSTGVFMIQSSDFNASDRWIEVYDALGKQIKKEKITSTITNIDIQNESKGVYFIKIKQNEDVIKITKLIKE